VSANTPSTPPSPDDVAVYGVEHPLMTPAAMKLLLPEGVRIDIDCVFETCYLVTHPVELDETTPARTKALARRFSDALDRDLRAAQLRNIQEHGLARPT
jgi:hypothetical protein